MSINNKLRYIGTSRSNSFKTFLIMAFLTGLITFLGLLVAYATNNPSYILLALIVAIGQNIISFFLETK
jgi:ABC-type Mn2+/Zn2+ transport system permease subunit